MKSVNLDLIDLVLKKDITIIQEIRDKDNNMNGGSFFTFMEQINQAYRDANPNVGINHREFGWTLSDKVGQTKRKEQYGFIYRM